MAEAFRAPYTRENDRVVHHLDAVWDPAWRTDLIRPYVLDGDEFAFGDAPRTEPFTGEKVGYRMEFRKI